jgi:hypothetical protein
MVPPRTYKNGEKGTLLVRKNRGAEKPYTAFAYCRGEVRRCGMTPSR